MSSRKIYELAFSLEQEVAKLKKLAIKAMRSGNVCDLHPLEGTNENGTMEGCAGCFDALAERDAALAGYNREIREHDAAIARAERAEKLLEECTVALKLLMGQTNYWFPCCRSHCTEGHGSPTKPERFRADDVKSPCPNLALLAKLAAAKERI